MSSDRAVRAATRARRSSLPARVISGASLDVSLALESDDGDFFGDDFESEAESVAALSPAAKRPCISNTSFSVQLQAQECQGGCWALNFFWGDRDIEVGERIQYQGAVVVGNGWAWWTDVKKIIEVVDDVS